MPLNWTGPVRTFHFQRLTKTSYSTEPMFSTRNRSIGTTIRAYPASISARFSDRPLTGLDAAGVPLAAGTVGVAAVTASLRVVPRMLLESTAEAARGTASAVAGRYWLIALVTAAAVFWTTGPASKVFFWICEVNSSWKAFWTSTQPGMKPEPGLA